MLIYKRVTAYIARDKGPILLAWLNCQVYGTGVLFESQLKWGPHFTSVGHCRDPYPNLWVLTSHIVAIVLFILMEIRSSS